MKTMKSFWLLGVGLLLTGGLQAAAGESWKAAVSLSASTKAKTYTLVNEKNLDWTSEDDPEDKYYGTGAYYLKFSITRGKAYTLTVKTASSAEGLSVDVNDVSYYDWDKETYLPSFDSSTDPDGTERYILRESEWDYGDGTKEDPGHDKTGTIYVYVSGEIDDTCDVQLQNGEVEYVSPQGSVENPLTVSSISTKEASLTKALVDDESYYFQFSLKKGKRYKFWTTGGTEDNSLSVDAEAGTGVSNPETYPYSDGVGENDGGVIVAPTASGNHLICVSGQEYGAKFTLHYQQLGSRSLAKHTAVDLGAATSKAVSAECEPEHRNNPESGYYDQIIDDDLFKVSLKKGKYYRFWTDGATADLVMELYDADGKVQVSNKRGFVTGKDCQLVYKAAATATYWVGVCQNVADDARITASPCTLNVQQISKGTLDSWDNGDDDYTGASVLVPGLTSSWKAGVKHGPHTFGATDWTDWYSLACRAGYTYKIGSVLTNAQDKSSVFALKATVYTISSKGKKTTVATIADLAKGGSFKASANATHYISVCVEGGQGVDYGPHWVSASVYDSKTSLGYLAVNIGGATVSEGAGWYVYKEDAVYAPGTIALPAGKYSICFAEVDGWSTPSKKTMTVTAGETVTLERKYTDSYDPADDELSGATLIKPTASGQNVSRSLWKDDKADWMKFKTVANSYYTLKLTGDAARLGDATMTVYGKDKKTVLAEGRDVTFLCRDDKKYYYVLVSHGGAVVDSQYVLNAKCVTVGVVGFEQSEYAVVDSKTSVSLKVARTGGSSGVLSVRVATMSDEAKAGVDYVPLTNVLTWANGDAASKTVKVALLPKLRDVYQGNRAFHVALSTIGTPESELAAGEYLPVIEPAMTEVTITDGSVKAVGTLQFAGTSDEFAEKPTSTKTTATVKAGENLTLWFKRTGGSQGGVGLKVNTADGTSSKTAAKAGTHYTRIKNTRVRWVDGDDELKRLVLSTVDLGSASAKTVELTVKAAIDTTCTDAAVLGSAKTLTVKIVDPSSEEDPEDDPLTAPSVIAPLSYEVLDPKGVVLRWSDAGDEVTYVLNVATDKTKLGKSGTTVRKYKTTETSYAFASGSLAYGTTYYWRVDATRDGKTATGSVKSFKTGVETKSGRGMLATVLKSGVVDAYGNTPSEPEVGLPYEIALVQGVDVGSKLRLASSNETSGASVTYALASSKYPLPDGLSISSGGKITGWPTKAGTFTTLLQAKQTKSKTTTPGTTLKVTFQVASQGVASGSFNGIVTTEDEAVVEGVNDGLAAATFGAVALTVRSTPKEKGNSSASNNIVAKVRLRGKTHTFKASNWTAVEPLLDNGYPGVRLTLSEVTTAKYLNSKKQERTATVTNRLSIVTTLAETSTEDALDRPMDIAVTLSLTAANERSVVRDIEWQGQALRDNTGISSVAAKAKALAGYNTLSLVSDSSAEQGNNTGLTGNGYLTMMVSAKGAVEYAGLLGDGSTKVSGSGWGFRSAASTDSGVDELVVPIYSATATGAFGGWLRVKLCDSSEGWDWQKDALLTAASVTVVTEPGEGETACAEPLRWVRTDAEKTYSGEGFCVPVSPVGGYYDTTANLQRYYYDLGSGLAIAGDCFETFVEKYLSDKLGEDKLLAWPGMGNGNQAALTILGNALSYPSQKLVYRDDNTKLIDWFKSTNPCGMTFTFTRWDGSKKLGSGVYSGSAQLYKGDDEAGSETAQAKLAKCYYRGVLLFARDPESTVLDAENVAPGMLYATVNTTEDEPRSVRASIPLSLNKFEKIEYWKEAGWQEGFGDE